MHAESTWALVIQVGVLGGLIGLTSQNKDDMAMSLQSTMVAEQASTGFPVLDFVVVPEQVAQELCMHIERRASVNSTLGLNHNTFSLSAAP